MIGCNNIISNVTNGTLAVGVRIYGSDNVIEDDLIHSTDGQTNITVGLVRHPWMQSYQQRIASYGNVIIGNEADYITVMHATGNNITNNFAAGGERGASIQVDYAADNLIDGNVADYGSIEAVQVTSDVMVDNSGKSIMMRGATATQLVDNEADYGPIRAGGTIAATITGNTGDYGIAVQADGPFSVVVTNNTAHLLLNVQVNSNNSLVADNSVGGNLLVAVHSHEQEVSPSIIANNTASYDVILLNPVNVTVANNDIGSLIVRNGQNFLMAEVHNPVAELTYKSQSNFSVNGSASTSLLGCCALARSHATP